MSPMKRSVVPLVVALSLLGCGGGLQDSDLEGTRGDELGNRGQSCERLGEQQCLRNSQCDAQYTGGICPMLACLDTNCPPCPPRTFQACITRCEFLNEAACLARSDCAAEYAPCPLQDCADPASCPSQCEPFRGCTTGGPVSIGGGDAGVVVPHP